MVRFMKSIVAGMAVLALLVLSGCGDSPPKTYAVKAYSGGNVIASFDASSYGSGDARIYAYLPNGRKNTVGGTFSVRRTDPGANSNTGRATKYIAELYSGGKVVETVNAASYSGSDGKVFLTVSQSSENIVFGGTYVLRNIGANLEGKSDASKFKVTAYSDGVLIGVWYADSFDTGNGRIILKVNGIDSALIIGGTYLIEQFR